MPLTPIHADLLTRIAANRNPDSYVAGATVLHLSPDSPRFSDDLDLFHDLEDSVAQSAEADAATLRAAGYELSWLLRTPSFHRAVVTAGGQQLKIEWAHDSAYRFFPVQQDDLCGYRLHDADAATNKVLALAGRSEIRDFVDVLHLHATYLSLGAMAWAACGKDPGYTPQFLLDYACRHVAYTQDDLDRLDLVEPLDLCELKRRWLAAVEDARATVTALPADEAGSLYLGADGRPQTPAGASRSHHLKRHTGSVRGAWPTVSPYGADEGTATGSG